MRLATSKLKHVTLWKDHITATGKTFKTAYQPGLGQRPGAEAFLCPHITSSLFSATSLQAHSQAPHSPSASSSPRPRGGGWESIWAFLLSVSCFICFFVLKKRRKNLSWMSCIETLALKLLQFSYSAPSIPTLKGLLSPDHWHDRNCGYHVTSSYCSLRGIRTSSHRLWTQYIITESPELHDHSDPAV